MPPVVVLAAAVDSTVGGDSWPCFVEEAQHNGALKVTALYADFGDVGEAVRMAEEAIAFLGGIDVLVNNAGITLNRPFWTNAGQPWLIERWRGISARRTGAPLTMALDIAGYSTVVGIACPAHYESAEAQLYGQMRYALWEAANLRCNRFFDNTAFVSFGAALDASLFGATILFPPGQAPWVDMQHPLLKDRDLSTLQPLSLTSGGLAPRAHWFYERMCELTEGSGIRVMYPTLPRVDGNLICEMAKWKSPIGSWVECHCQGHCGVNRTTVAV